MAAETLKDFLVGVGFEVDEAGSAQAESVIENLNTIIRQLGEILTAVADGVKGLVDGAVEGAEAFDETAESIQSETEAAQENADAMRESTEAVRESTEANKEGAESVKEHGEEQEKAGKKAEEAGKQYKKADEAAKMKGAKEGASNVQNLDGQLKKASGTIKKFAAAAIAMLVGSGIKSAIVDTIKFSEELVKSAKSMNKTVEEARAYNTALKVMGKTAQEIQADDSLKATFEDLQGIGQQLALPAAAEGVTTIRSLMDAFTQLKFVAQYALQWIMYKVQTVAEGPLMEVHDLLTGMREWFAGNIQKIAEGIATAFGWVVQLFTSLIKTVQSVIGWIDKLPPSIKIVGAVALAVIAAIQSKTALVTLIVTGILLLLDDLQTYLEGGDSLFGGFWGACITAVEKLQPHIEQFFQDFNAGLEFLGGLLGDLVNLLGGDVVVAIGAVAAALWLISANPVIGIISGVMLLIAALGSLGVSWDDVKKKAGEVWEKITGWITNAWETISGAWASAGEWFTNIWNSIVSGASNIWAKISAPFIAAWTWIKGIWDQVTGFFSGIWSDISGGEGLSGILEAISAPFVSAYEAIKGVWDTVTGWFSGIFGGVKDDENLSGIEAAISTPFSGAWSTIEGAFSGALETVTGWFSGLGEGVATAVGDLSSWATGAWETITGALGTAGTTIARWFSGIDISESVSVVSDWASGAWDTISGALGSAATTISGWFSGIDISESVAAVSDWASGAWDTISGFFDGAASTISGWFSGIDLGDIVTDVSGWATTAWDNITNAFSGVTDWFTTTFSGIGDTVSAAVGDVADWATETWEDVKDTASSIGGWFASLFGWGSEDDSAAADAEAKSGEVGSSSKAALMAAFEGADTEVAAVFESMLTLSDTSIGALVAAMELAATTVSDDVAEMEENVSSSLFDLSADTESEVSTTTEELAKIVNAAQKMAQGFASAIKGMPTSAKIIFAQLATSMVSSMTTATTGVINLVNRIKSAINSIPKKISISGPNLPGHSEGGVVEHETISRLGEGNLREYVIPVMKPSRAIPLLKQAAADLGMTVDSARHATALLGGNPSGNITPAYAAGGGSTVNNVTNNNYNNTVNAPLTQNITGTNDRSIADMAAKDHENITLRNIKSVFA